MTIIKSDKILEELKKEDSDESALRIIPKPSFNLLEKTGTGSIDLRLGRWFLLLKESRISLLDVNDKKNEPSIKHNFVPFGEKFILHPMKFVLGSTLEWIRLPSSIAGYVTGKSSWGRRGLIIETAAGIQPNFSGCLTLELANMGEVPIALYPGMQICQIFLHLAEGDGINKSGQFSGRRRPALGSINIDEVVHKLNAPH